MKYYNVGYFQIQEPIPKNDVITVVLPRKETQATMCRTEACSELTDQSEFRRYI
jgi:hypothetical protein